ncbi:MAG: glycosyltransferase, partial [Campylobacterales bacterium]|nr:glycosyltransferase [Campylobacterales bacterium]
MKKKILFVMPSLSAGGAEKSLVNLLSQFDFDKFEVNLILFNNSGLFLRFVPEKVKLLEMSPSYLTFSQKLNKSVWNFIREKHINLAYARL